MYLAVINMDVGDIRLSISVEKYPCVAAVPYLQPGDMDVMDAGAACPPEVEHAVVGPRGGTIDNNGIVIVGAYRYPRVLRPLFVLDENTFNICSCMNKDDVTGDCSVDR